VHLVSCITRGVGPSNVSFCLSCPSHIAPFRERGRGKSHNRGAVTPIPIEQTDPTAAAAVKAAASGSVSRPPESPLRNGIDAGVSGRRPPSSARNSLHFARPIRLRVAGPNIAAVRRQTSCQRATSRKTVHRRARSLPPPPALAAADRAGRASAEAFVCRAGTGRGVVPKVADYRVCCR